MTIGGFSPSWCTTRSTRWPTNRKRLSRRWKPMKRDYRRKTIRTWQPCSQSCGRRVINGGRLGSPRSPVIAAVRVMVVVRRVWGIAAGILRSATDAIRWGTLHGIVQALHWWRAEHRQRQRQRQQQRQRQRQRQRRWRRHQLRTIGWQSLAYPLRRRAGTWIVLPPLTFAEIGKSSYGTRSMPKEISGKFTTFLKGSQARPSDMETCDWSFGCQDITETMRLLWETSWISKKHTTRCHNCGLWIGDCGLSQSIATESRYTINCRQTVLEVKVEEILWA